MKSRAFTLIELMIVIAIIAVVAAIAIPNLISSRKNANEAAAIGSLKTIITAQTLFREADRNVNNTLDFATTLGELANTGPLGDEDLIDDVLATGTRQGYDFVIGNVVQPIVWTCSADATLQATTGDRHFAANMAGLIFFDGTAPVVFQLNGTSSSPVIGQ
ncbi:MAG: prepilin-type N-terminal cleavage/methylation domain-containing protein [Planctomycetes bacterium]|nr:prepilin-type N-terminal cleavage/methylation domain-containing protein [Planctomycetota bacterium]